MKITYVKLVNFLGIYLAMQQTELELDFTNNNNRIIILTGSNGSGKTSIMDSLTPYPEIYRSRKDSNFIIEGKDGLKEIHFLHNNIKYITKIHYLSNKTRCEFFKIVNNETIDMNPTGLVRSYEEALYNEFGIEPHHNKLLYIGQDLTNIIKLSPSERKNFIGEFLQHIEEYLEAYKNITKYYTKLKNDIDVISFELNKLGNKDDIYINEQSILQKIDSLNNIYDKYIAIRAKVESDIKYITKNNDLISYFKSLRNSLSNTSQILDSLNIKYNTYKTKLEDNIFNESVDQLKSRILNMEKDIEKIKYTLDTNNAELYELISIINNLKNQKASKEVLLNDYINKSNIDSLLKEYNNSEKELNNLKPNIDYYKKDIENIELYKFNKNEASLYLNIIENIIDKVNRIRDMYSKSNILEDYINNTLDINIKKLEEEALLQTIDSLDKRIQKVLSTINYYEEKKNLSDTLIKKPNNCNNKNCPLLIEANKFSEIFSNIDMYYEERDNIKKEIEITKNKLKTIDDYFNNVTNFYREIEELDSFIHKNNELICKFPDYMIINDFNKLFNSTIYLLPRAKKYLEYSYVLERKEILENNICRINELINNNKKYNNIIIDIKSDIDKINEEINIKTKKYDEKNILVNNLKNDIKCKSDKLNTIIDFLNLKSELIKNLKAYKSLFDTIKSTQFNYYITSYLSFMNTKLNKLIDDINNNIKSLRDEYAQIQYKVLKFEELRDKLSIIESKFEKVDILKKTWSPTTGIPLYFIEEFMENIKTYANAYLHDIWGDELKIDGFNIDEKEFRIMISRFDGEYIAKDASLCSAGEIAIICTVISLALLKSASHNKPIYNIVRLDEIDNNLDYKKRSKFVTILNGLLDEINNEQTFLITHNDEFDKDVDLILLRGSDLAKSRNIKNSNIIFQY